MPKASDDQQRSADVSDSSGPVAAGIAAGAEQQAVPASAQPEIAGRAAGAGEDNRASAMTEGPGYTKFSLVLTPYASGSMPLAKLAMYLKHFGAILGKEAVYARLQGRAFAVEARVPSKHAAAAIERAANATDPGSRQHGAYLKIYTSLMKDGGLGHIEVDDRLITEFKPGAIRQKRTRENDYLIREFSELRGQVIAVGDRRSKQKIPVVLARIDSSNAQASGVQASCVADTELAKELAAYLYQDIKVSGSGEWVRKTTAAGSFWHPVSFEITAYSRLSDSAVNKVFDGLKSKLHS